MIAEPAAPLDGPRLAPLAGGDPNLLIVVLHGYGSCGAEMLHLAWGMQAALPTAAFACPDAPDRLAPLADGRQWWPLASFAPAELAAGVEGAAPGLDAFLDRELAAHGLADDRLVLVGFSQGMMMALHVGLRRANAPAGIVGLSGMLVAPERLVGEIRGRPPVVLLHGTADDVVPFAEQHLAALALKAADVPVECHDSPGVGHWIGADGPAIVAEFVARIADTKKPGR